MASNPANVQQLVAFFRQNSSLPLDQLKQSAQETGYTNEDIEAAAQGFQPANQVSLNSPGIAPKKIILVALAIIAVLGIIFAAFAAFSPKKPGSETQTLTPSPAIPTVTASASAVFSPSPKKIDNPLAGFKAFLSGSLYKIETKGKLAVAETTASSSGTISLNLDDAAFYLKNGEVVRADLNEEGTRESLLFRDSTLYFLDHSAKTITALNSQGKLASESPLYPLFHYSFPPAGLLEAQDQGKLIWQKNSEQEWQSEWAYPLLVQGTKTKPFAIKILLNSTKRLMKQFSLKKDVSSPWQDINFTYIKLASLDPDLTLPKDYKIASLSAALARPSPTATPSATPKK